MARTAPRPLVVVPAPEVTDQVIRESISAVMDITGTQQKDLAALIDMSTDKLSKSLGGTRRFRAPEVARIAWHLDVKEQTFYLGADEIRRRAVAGISIEPTDFGPDQGTSASSWKEHEATILRFPEKAAA